MFVTIGAEVHKQMFRSGGQSDAIPLVFNSQASLVVSPSIVPSGNFADLNRTVTCLVLKANTTGVLLVPCHDEFRGPRSDYVRQSGCQFVAKPSVFSSQASLVFIYQPNEGMKGEVTLLSPESEPWTCSVEQRYAYTQPLKS
ncbi:hypothetical protein TNCV_1040791 [Trichonephila clavipes]|nr:hypothetical protein TNCV_1040791 [Trichonephila clavipes]